MQPVSRNLIVLAGATALSLGLGGCTQPASTTPPTAVATASMPSTAFINTTGVETGAPAPSAADILTKAKANALNATSGAFTGHIDQDGKAMVIDYKGTADGKSADVSLEVVGQGKVRVIAVPGAAYIQADEKFWKSQGAPAAVQKAGDKFVKAPANASTIADSLSLNAYLDKAFGAVTTTALSDTVGSETVDGVDTWVLTDKKGPEEGALYVSQDSFQVVRYVAPEANPGQLDFSRWNEDLGIKAPPASQILAIG
jgi:hypothetical protein